VRRYRYEPICDPAALDDWRANDEAPPAYDWQGLHNYTGEETHYELRKHTLSEKQKEALELLLRRLKEADELEARKRGAVRKEGET
jgi:hypothetical protein